MSKKADLKTLPVEVPKDNFEIPHNQAIAPEFPAPVMKLQEVDRLNLEIAKANRRAALARAKQAISENEASELSYKYFVLQLYMRYGLNENDAISENGEILKGQAALIKSQQG